MAVRRMKQVWSRYLEWRNAKPPLRPLPPRPINKIAADPGDVATAVTANITGDSSPT